ncbi:site-specific DNA-methyltransferase [Cysteiniphilum litorale]|uniref:site-specific DNA-methyltransferase n=1 Tax=Cysteiniphilum litorale TaxID=2056700 RepID=UPI003F885C43
MIYIDPPYNTGNDFVYKDNFRESEEDYLKRQGLIDDEGNHLIKNSKSSGRFHSNWLNMMYPRLILARDFLRDDGVIFISIDETEQSNLKKICDEIFGEENFINNLIWQSRTSISNDQEISLNHNHTLIYAKKREVTIFYGLPLDPSDYLNPDNDPRGPWKLVPIDANKPGGNTNYGITNPNTGEEYFPPNGRSWAINQQDFQKLLDDGRIKFGMSDDSSPKRKLYYEERLKKGDTKTPSSILLDAGSTKTGTTELMGLFENLKLFDYPKPTTLLCRLMSFVCSKGSNDIILDFFAGSGSTSHALLKYNVEFSCNHNFISVQLPENLTESLKVASGLTLKTIQNAIAFLENLGRPLTLSEISKERIRRASKKIQDENPDYQGDLGFKVFKLSESNIVPEAKVEVETSEQLFDLFEQNAQSRLKKGWSPERLLVEVMLLEGMPLDSFISTRRFAENTVIEVSSDITPQRLQICLDTTLSKTLIEEIALGDHDRFICLDLAISDANYLRLADKGMIKTI